ncbi:MAG: GTPase [bacterium]
MPANLTPQYLGAEQRFREAKTREEKIAALEEMYALIPKHKGTDRMQGDIKRRLSKLRTMEEKKAAKQKDLFYISREGAGQVILIGAPNCGKSLLFNRLTGARSESAPYPFTTSRAAPGMMPYQDIKIQLVDTPPFSPERPPMAVSNMLRNTDLILLIVDISDKDPQMQISEVVDVAARMRLILTSEPPREIEPGNVWKKTILAANKCDTPDDEIVFNILKETIEDRFLCLHISAQNLLGLEELKEELYRQLDIVRVYSKQPGAQPDMDAPFVMKRGGTLMELARMVHKDFADNLKYARIWGTGKFKGQMVHRDYLLQDKDIVELHT